MVPFGDLLAILKMGVKDKDRASPHMGMLKVMVIRLGLGENL
jgi:hypothetical protein